MGNDGSTHTWNRSRKRLGAWLGAHRSVADADRARHRTRFHCRLLDGGDGRRNILDSSPRLEARPLPSITDTLLGAIDIMQERIAQARLVGESPEVLHTPSLGQFGPFEYHRAALLIAAGREAVAQMLPAIRNALSA